MGFLTGLVTRETRGSPAQSSITERMRFRMSKVLA
jgi:hypothetical protein